MSDDGEEVLGADGQLIRVDSLLIKKIKIEEAARQKGDQIEAEMMVHKMERDRVKLAQVEALEEARLVGLAYKEEMRIKAIQRALDNENDKQRLKREDRERAVAEELARLQEIEEKEALRQKRMKALMDPDRDPSAPLPLDEAEAALMTKDERKQCYIDNQIFALTAFEDQIMELERTIIDTRKAEGVAKIEAAKAHREATITKKDAEQEQKLCAIDRRDKQREYTQIEKSVEIKQKAHDELVIRLEELKITQERTLKKAVDARLEQDELHKILAKSVVAATHGEADVTKDKERMVLLNKVAKIQKHLTKLRMGLREHHDRYRYCHKTSSRKAEFKQVYEDKLAEVDTLASTMESAVAADASLDEERRQKDIDSMAAAGEVLAVKRKEEQEAIKALGETTQQLAATTDDVEGATQKAVVDMHVADAERLKAVQAEGVSDQRLNRAKKLFKHANLQQRHMEQSARRTREVTTEIAQKKIDYGRLREAFTRVTGKKYRLSRQRQAEIQASAAAMVKALKEPVEEKKKEIGVKLVKEEVTVAESAAKWCGFDDADPAMLKDGRLGVKEPPSSANQNIAFVAAQLKRAELEQIEFMKTEVVRLEVERVEAIAAAKKLEAARKAKVYEDKKAAQLVLREQRIKQVQLDRLAHREWERQKDERERKAELEKRYQERRAQVQALQEEKLRRRGLLGSIKSGKTVRPWRPGTTNSLAERFKASGDRRGSKSVDHLSSKAIQMLDSDPFPTAPVGTWWPDGAKDEIVARTRANAGLDFKRSIMKHESVSGAMSAIVEREGENVCRHLGTTRPHTVLGMQSPVLGMQSPTRPERSPGDAFCNTWRPKHVLTPLWAGAYGRSPAHSLSGMMAMSP